MNKVLKALRIDLDFSSVQFTSLSKVPGCARDQTRFVLTYISQTLDVLKSTYKYSVGQHNRLAYIFTDIKQEISKNYYPIVSPE